MSTNISLFINSFILIEFPHWGGMCDQGKRQSPINLSLRGAIKGIYDKLEIENYDKTITQAALVNTGHSGKFSRDNLRKFQFILMIFLFLTISSTTFQFRC